MSPTETIAIVAMTIYAIYKQSIKQPVVGKTRFIGTWQYMTHQAAEHGGFGEVLILIGLMVALQAEIIWRRALALGVQPAPTSATAAAIP